MSKVKAWFHRVIGRSTQPTSPAPSAFSNNEYEQTAKRDNDYEMQMVLEKERTRRFGA